MAKSLWTIGCICADFFDRIDTIFRIHGIAPEPEILSILKIL